MPRFYQSRPEYKNSDTSRQVLEMITKHNIQRQVTQVDHAAQKQLHKRKAKSHAIEIELTKKQSDEFLYVAFRPTRKELCRKR